MGTPSHIYLSPLSQTLEIQINNIKLPPKNLNFKLGMIKSKLRPTPLFFFYFVTYSPWMTSVTQLSLHSPPFKKLSSLNPTF